MLAAYGVTLDSSILIVGAMAAGPEFGPPAGIRTGLVLRRRQLVSQSGKALVAGFVVATLLTGAFGALPALLGLSSRSQFDSPHPATRFIRQPTADSFVMALPAGIAGVLSRRDAAEALRNALRPTPLRGRRESATRRVRPGVGESLLRAVPPAWCEGGEGYGLCHFFTAGPRAAASLRSPPVREAARGPGRGCRAHRQGETLMRVRSVLAALGCAAALALAGAGTAAADGSAPSTAKPEPKTGSAPPTAKPGDGSLTGPTDGQVTAVPKGAPDTGVPVAGGGSGQSAAAVAGEAGAGVLVAGAGAFVLRRRTQARG